MTLDEYTEFDEQSSTLEEALQRVYNAARLYYAGDETFGVLMAYERAALAKGATLSETEARMAQARTPLQQ
jgi:hypothetical protein